MKPLTAASTRPQPVVESLAVGMVTNSNPPENPIKLLREQENLSLAQLAKLTGVNLQAIHLVEQGCYFPILARLELWASQVSDFSRQELNERYMQYQSHTRRLFGEIHNFPLLELSDLGPTNWFEVDLCPLLLFNHHTLKVTRTSLAKGLCIQPAILYKLAQNLYAKLPVSLYTALQEAGLSDRLIDELEQRTTDYYNLGRR